MNEELLDSLLSSLADITDELWTIRWNHVLCHLGYELPIYLRGYCPAPEHMLYQLVSALDPKYQRCFGPSKLEKWQMQPRILQLVAHPQFNLNPESGRADQANAQTDGTAAETILSAEVVATVHSVASTVALSRFG